MLKIKKDLERRMSRTLPALSKPFNKLNRKVVQLLIFKDKSKKTTSNCGSAQEFERKEAQGERRVEAERRTQMGAERRVKAEDEFGRRWHKSLR